jgi:hypothetical protein
VLRTAPDATGPSKAIGHGTLEPGWPELLAATYEPPGDDADDRNHEDELDGKPDDPGNKVQQGEGDQRCYHPAADQQHEIEGLEA